MITEYIVEDASIGDLPMRPDSVMSHFKELFDQIPEGASNPMFKVSYPGVYSVSYERILTAEEEEEAMEQAREANRIATEDLIKEEKAELRRLLARYGHD